jgi:hypothetical protein
MIRSIATFTTLVALTGITVAASSVSHAADDSPATTPTAGLLWQTTSTARPDAAELRAVEEIADQVPGNHVDAANARVVPTGFGRELVVARTDADALCIVAVQGVEMPLRQCGSGFPASGVSATYVSAPNGVPSLIGVVADDVTDLAIVLDDGSSRTLEPDAGAFWWIGDRGERVVRLETTRAGEPFTDSEIFASDPGA